MTKNAQSALLSPGPLLLTGLIVLAALSRVLPHPPNFSPVEAMALFGGAYFARRGLAVLIPLLAMLISDVALKWRGYLASPGSLLPFRKKQDPGPPGCLALGCWWRDSPRP